MQSYFECFANTSPQFSFFFEFPPRVIELHLLFGSSWRHMSRVFGTERELNWRINGIPFSKSAREQRLGIQSGWPTADNSHGRIIPVSGPSVATANSVANGFKRDNSEWTIWDYWA
jgi:hypothetical protein